MRGSPPLHITINRFTGERSFAMSKKNEIKAIWSDRKRTFLGLPWTFTKYFLTETKFITRTGWQP